MQCCAAEAAEASSAVTADAMDSGTVLRCLQREACSTRRSEADRSSIFTSSAKGRVGDPDRPSKDTYLRISPVP